MEQGALTLERLGQLHATAYRAENKSDRTITWHTSAIARYSAWVQEELGKPATLSALTLENMRQYVCHLFDQPCRSMMPNQSPRSQEKMLSADTVSWHVRGLRAFAS